MDLDLAPEHARLVLLDPAEPPVEGFPDDKAGWITGRDWPGTRLAPIPDRGLDDNVPVFSI